MLHLTSESTLGQPRAESASGRGGHSSKTAIGVMDRPTSFRQVGSYVLAGVGASLILGAIEWTDLTVRSTPYLHSFVQRLVLTSYFSIDILVGALLGLAVGLSVFVAATVNGVFTRAAGLVVVESWFGRLISVILTCSIFAMILVQHSRVKTYAMAQLREAEKTSFLNQPLLYHERAASYLLVFAMLAGCWVLWRIAAGSRTAGRPVRYLLIAASVIMIFAVYYSNSRLHVQLYEHSFHHSLFLLNTALSMALTGILYYCWPALTTLIAFLKTGSGRIVWAAALVILATSIGITFQHFDKDQTLKVQVFYQTQWTSCDFQLVRWALDFDRDGYSSLLGGGDCNDHEYEINPGRPEIMNDGIDNNCIGGDLTQSGIDAWQQQFSALHAAPGQPISRMNIIYIFIDALRADHLGTYGYKRNTSPNLDRLASRSTVFENAYTPAPNTFEAMPKFMKSCYWDAHI
ncbi:MAG: sulfatase-like hydrolase/transferase, partial [Blastocatellia bacterium]